MRELDGAPQIHVCRHELADPSLRVADVERQLRRRLRRHARRLPEPFQRVAPLALLPQDAPLLHEVLRHLHPRGGRLRLGQRGSTHGEGQREGQREHSRGDPQAHVPR